MLRGCANSEDCLPAFCISFTPEESQQELSALVMTHFDFRYLLSRKDVVVKRSEFARTAIALSVQGDQLAPTRPGRDNATEARVPGSNSSNATSSMDGNCKKKAPKAYIMPVACTMAKINQYLRFMSLPLWHAHQIIPQLEPARKPEVLPRGSYGILLEWHPSFAIKNESLPMLLHACFQIKLLPYL